MSMEVLEERVGKLEVVAGELRTEQRVQGQAIGDLRRSSEAIISRLDEIRQVQAAAPRRQDLRTIIGTLGSVASVIAALCFFVWWFIETSPAMRETTRRLDKLDDPQVGRVTRIEREGSWTARVGK